jgi:hypothetical protein
MYMVLGTTGDKLLMSIMHGHAKCGDAEREEGVVSTHTVFILK